MSVNSTFDVDSVGGGYGGMGGFGGGAFPLWLLIFLGLGKDNGGLFGGNSGNAGAGVLAGETQAKLDCLSKGQETITREVLENRQDGRFNELGNSISELAAINRTGQEAIRSGQFDLATQLAACCCDLKTGQLETNNAIAMQTNELNVNASNNTQKLLDAINTQNTAILEADNSRLREQLNRSEIIAAVTAQCGPKSECNGNGGDTDININVLRLLMAQAQSAAPATVAQAAPVK